MKILNLVFANLKNLYKSNKLILFIVLLGVSVSFVALSLITGTVAYLINTSRGGNIAGTFSIEIDEDIDNINEVVDDLLETDEDITHLLLVTAKENEPMLVGMKGNYEQWYVLDSGRIFNDDEIKNAERVAILSSELYQKDDFEFLSYKYKINDKYFSTIGLSEIPTNRLLFSGSSELYDKLYGIASGSSTKDVDFHDDHDQEYLDDETDVEDQTIIIPYTTYLKMGFRPKVIRIQYFIKSNRHREEIMQSLEKRFPNQRLHVPDKPETMYSSEIIKNLFLSLSIFLLSIINIIALFAYWLGINRRQYNIYHMLGAKEKVNKAIIFIEWFFIVVLAYAVSLIIRIIISPFAKLVMSDTNFKLSKDLLIFSTTYIASSLFLLPSIRRVSKVNISILRGGE